MEKLDNRFSSLENLVESEDLGIEILHPGGMDITNELAWMCQLGKENTVPDIASGTGESACYLAKNFSCHVVGVDASEYMIARAKQKAAARDLYIEFHHGNAHELPFDDNTFDAIISECTTCIMDETDAKGIRTYGSVKNFFQSLQEVAA